MIDFNSSRVYEAFQLNFNFDAHDPAGYELCFEGMQGDFYFASALHNKFLFQYCPDRNYSCHLQCFVLQDTEKGIARVEKNFTYGQTGLSIPPAWFLLMTKGLFCLGFKRHSLYLEEKFNVPFTNHEKLEESLRMKDLGFPIEND